MSAEKVGSGALQAWLRQGSKEMSQVLPAFRESVQVIEEPGAHGLLGGNLTPAAIDRQMTAETPPRGHGMER